MAWSDEENQTVNSTYIIKYKFNTMCASLWSGKVYTELKSQYFR